MKEKLSYRTFIEHTEYEIEEFPTEFINQLINRGICLISKKKAKFIATGFMIYKNTFIIIFPKTYILPTHEKTLREHIQVLFKVLLKYRREANINAEEMDLLGGQEGKQNESLVTAYYLIKDFTHNGFLLKENRIKTLQYAGNIDWGATMNKRQPIISGRSVIYTDTISQKTAIDRQNRLYIIHKYCVSKSIEKYGWLIGISSQAGVDKIELEFDTSYAIQFLINELNSTFIEREINLIKVMIDFLSGLDEKNKIEEIETLITPYFQNVWELICSNLFHNQYRSLKGIIPKLNWEIESKATVQKQRPDIMFLEKQKMYILDAKYYNIASNLPGWPDVVKQLFYAKTIFKNIKSVHFNFPNKNLEYRLKNIENIENVFLFPSGDNELIKYVGNVSIENNSDFDDINAYKLNTYFAMKCFIGKERYNFVEQLLEESKRRHFY